MSGNLANYIAFNWEKKSIFTIRKNLCCLAGGDFTNRSVANFDLEKSDQSPEPTEPELKQTPVSHQSSPDVRHHSLSEESPVHTAQARTARQPIRWVSAVIFPNMH